MRSTSSATLAAMTFLLPRLFARRAVTGVASAFTSTARLAFGVSLSTSSSARFMTTVDPLTPVEEAKMPLYAMGVNIGLQVGGQGNFQVLLNEDELEVVLEGFCDQMRGTILQGDAKQILTKHGPTLNRMLQERSNSLMDRVKQAGADYVTNFLDCNPESIKTESGLIYCPMKEGDGQQPTISNTVEVHYHGTLTDGTVFDSSVDRGQTISFPLSSVIKGWQEGLALMKEGGKATLVIPPELGYGDAGSGDVIPPGCTLKFEVELYKVS